MASCFDISIIDAWNTGDENVTNGSVDDYDLNGAAALIRRRKSAMQLSEYVQKLPAVGQCPGG